MYLTQPKYFPNFAGAAASERGYLARQTRQLARGLFNTARNQGILAGLVSLIRGKPGKLMDLAQTLGAQPITGGAAGGIRNVDVDAIRGSEGRTEDFDRAFHPLHERSRDRWMSVAQARLMGEALPVIELIQVGKDYFVRDGHHRISVAKALGQKAIEAEVIVYR